MSKYNANDYKPYKKGVSDKFSWNLYKAFKEYMKFDSFRIVRIGWNGISGKCSLEDGGFYIEIDGSCFPVTGNIVRIMSSGHKKVMGCCVSWGGEGISSLEKQDVTEWFMREYLRIGRCLVVPEWSHKFAKINKNSRKCVHCGLIQYRKIETRKKIQRKEVWSGIK